MAPVHRGAQGLLARRRACAARRSAAGSGPRARSRSARPRASADGRPPARSPAAARRARCRSLATDSAFVVGQREAGARLRAPARRTATPRRMPASASRPLRLGQRQRRHPPVGLAAHPERGPARRQHHDVGSGLRGATRPPRRRLRAGARSCRGRAAPGARPDRRRAACSSRHARQRAHPQRLGDRRADQRSVAQRRQLDPPGAVREPLQGLRGGLQRQAGSCRSRPRRSGS